MSLNSPPDPIPEYLSACLDYVQRTVGMGLDFTPETLPVLDHYLALVRPTLSDRPELAPLVARAVGAYFGEIIRGKMRGFWKIPSQNVHDWAVCFQVVFLWVNPVGIAYDALYGSTEHDGPRSVLRVAPEDHDFIHQRLQAMPPLPEDEFFLLTTRYEAIEVAVEALRAKMQESGDEGVEFSEEDYEFGLRPLN